jgi:hypothetical protein
MERILIITPKKSNLNMGGTSIVAAAMPAAGMPPIILMAQPSAEISSAAQNLDSDLDSDSAKLELRLRLSTE